MSEPGTAPAKIIELVERFKLHEDAYCSDTYNEEQLRHEFLFPFFEELGWDVGNKSGYAEPYKDVVHEGSIRLGGVVKSPDYCFRVGGTRKFFLEAKKPAVNIKDSQEPAWQLRRYCWSAKLPLSILTNFQGFAVYDGGVKPARQDPASCARILYIDYTEYPDRWAEIGGIFAKEAVYRGLFDKFAESRRAKKGTTEVDAEFLREIEDWRSKLAGHIRFKNRNLGQDELNFAVQRTIDRIIFLRICEDRGVEPYGRLQGLLNGGRIYQRLVELYHSADERYNSGLFHFGEEKGRHETPDYVTPKLDIGDTVLKEIIERLYYPKSPYEFSYIPADLLGQVYEQFLGKVIRLTAGRAVVEEKPEVKKAGGVYYTPTYIVDYIVKNTVGKLLEGKTPKEAANLKILDPACGSGSFLIGAYQYLLDWHLAWYSENDPEAWAKKKTPPVYQAPTAGADGPYWRLTAAERKRILINSIYGVDIDAQAVEVTKLSLLLKVLEGQSGEAIDQTLRLYHQRALPDLGDNIKCGNSLIGTDFYSEHVKDLTDEERRRVNAFDWDREFRDIMKAGGFDAVIGNPPYIFGEYHDTGAGAYFRSHFRLAKGQYDTYWLFIEQGAKLTNPRSRFSLIVPDALLVRDEARDVRGVLLASGLSSIFHCGIVFAASVSTVVFTIAKDSSPQSVLSLVPDGASVVLEHECSRARFDNDPEHRFTVHLSNTQAALLDKLRQTCYVLKDVVDISRGEETGKSTLNSGGCIPIIVGDDIRRYYINAPSRRIARITKNPAIYDTHKIVVVKTGRQCIAALDLEGIVTMQSVYNLTLKDMSIDEKALLGILNSRFVDFFVSKTFTAYKLLFPQMNQTTIQSIPVPISLDSHTQLVELVDRMLSLHKQLAAATLPHDKDSIQRQIEATDREIDRLVYELYGLTEEEIALVEESMA